MRRGRGGRREGENEELWGVRTGERYTGGGENGECWAYGHRGGESGEGGEEA